MKRMNEKAVDIDENIQAALSYTLSMFVGAVMLN